MAVRLAQPRCNCEVQQPAITKYASEVLPQDECCELILHLRARKSARRTLSKVYKLRGLKYTAATGFPFARPMCPKWAFQQRWHELLAPLELESTSDQNATDISWPRASRLRYIANQPPLCRMIVWYFLLTFIVQGDGYPCASGEWSELSACIVNRGLSGRITACVWVVKLAISGDKQMATSATVWTANIEVRFVHEQLLRRRCGNLSALATNAIMRAFIYLARVYTHMPFGLLES